MSAGKQKAGNHSDLTFQFASSPVIEDKMQQVGKKEPQPSSGLFMCSGEKQFDLPIRMPSTEDQHAHLFFFNTWQLN